MYKKIQYRFISVLLVMVLISSFFTELAQAAFKSVSDDTGFKISLNWNKSSDPNSFVYDSEKSESKMIRLRVYYESKKVGKNYNPGEIAITVPGLKDAMRSGQNPQLAVAADKASSKNKVYDWSYTYSLTSNTYTFTNNKTINENTTFQGSFEIIWQVNSRSSKDGYIQNFQSKLRTAYNDEAVSNTISYEQTRKRDEFNISQKTEALYPYEIPPSNITEDQNYKDYVWINYKIKTSQQTNARDLQPNKRKYKLYFLKGAVVNGLTKTGEVKNIDGYDYECYETNSINSVTVAYKRSDFKDYPEIKNYVEFYGQYYEEDSEVFLDKCEGSYSLSDFELKEWLYGTTPYQVGKTMYGEHDSYINSIDSHCGIYGAIKSTSLEKGNYNYRIEMGFTLLGATPNNKYDVELLDNEMQIQTVKGSYRRLRDDEYNFTSVAVPSYSCIENKNKVSSEIQRDNKYKFDIFIRRNGNEEFDNEPFKQGVLTSNQQNISVPSDTVGIKVMYYGLDEYFTSPTTYAYVVFHTSDDDIMTKNGQVINFLKNSVYSYNSDSDGEGYHLHSYIEREASLHIHEIIIHEIIYEIRNTFSVSNHVLRDEDVDDSEYFNFNGFINAQIGLAQGNDLSAFSLYTIVPEGLQLNARYNTPDKLIDRLSFSGTGLNSGYIKQHTTLEIIKNYKNSGRTYIAIHFDFSDAPIKTSSIKVGNIPMCGTRDSLSALTQNWTMRAAMIIDQEGKWYSSSTDSSSYEGEIWKDIDGDGNTSETASFSSNISETIWNPGHSNIELTKLVKTELLDTYTYASTEDYEDEDGNHYKDYIDNTISKTYANSEYSYKIRAGIGSGSAKNIVIVDNLEQGPKQEWQGDFVDIKTDSGNPTIYYSSDIITDKPDFVNDTRWTTDKSTLDRVRSVAVDYGDYELTEDKYLYAEIIMKSPTELGDLDGKITENNSRIYYDNYNNQSELVGIVELPSNEVPVKLTAFMGDIRILKTDKTSGLGLEGAKFDVYRQDGDTPNPSTDIVIQSGLTTDSSGTAKITDLKYGNYYLIETAAPKGYEKPSGEPIMAVLQDSKPNKLLTVNVPNQRKEGQVTVVKTSDRNSSACIEGAEFAIYKSDGTLVQEGLTTGSDGVLMINGLEWGDYYLVETKAPKGYIKSDKKYDFTISASNDAGKELMLKVENEQIPASVILTKYEALEDGTKNPANVPIDNAGYQLYDSNNNLLGTYMTDSYGKIYVEDLTFGKYYFKETIAAKGYQKYPDNIYFTVDENHIDVALEVETTDTRLTGQVWMQKVDDIGQYVKGAKYALFRKSDNVQVDVTGQPSSITFTTNAEGLLEDSTYVQNGILQGLYWGEYYLKEVESPTGYELNDTKYYITISRDNANNIIMLDNVVDNRQRGKVVLTKVAEDDETLKLKGAEFTLYRSDGSVYRDNLQPSDENGEIEVTDIEWGSYYFLEKTAPAGYGLNPDKIRFSVNYLTANKTQYLTVTDPAKKCDLTVTKRIYNNEVWFAHGNPTFTFRVEGTDIDGNKCTFYRAVTFNENSTADESGYLSQSVVFSGLKAGTYTVSEVGSIRYTDTKWESIEGELVNGTEPTYNLDSDKPAHVRFTNSKTVQSATSHTAQTTNIIKVQSKVTSIAAVWSGPKSVRGTSITAEMLKQYLDVYKIYDDGSKEEVAYGNYNVTYQTFEDGVSGDYTVYVKYTEGGRTFEDSFDLYFNLPSAVTTKLLSSEPFTDTDGISYDGTVAVTGYTGNSTTLKIPTSVIGLNELTSVGNNQSTGTIKYTDNNKLYKVVSVQPISSYKSIYGVNNVKNLIISDSVTSIGSYAFYQCSGLTSVTIGNSVTTIGHYAFYKCTGLTGELTIPNSVTLIGGYAFYNCTGLTGELTIPDSVTTIGNEAFYKCTGLTGELTIPDSVTTISMKAFSDCTGLTGKLTIPDSITTIGWGAFYNCTGLTGELKIPDSITKIENLTFANCKGLTGELKIPDSVTLIGSNAFSGCSGLTGELTIPDSVTSIGNNAFQSCTGLTGELKIPDSVTTIGDSAFYNCTGLTGELKIPDSVTTIGSSAFYNCKGLTGELKIPDSVTTIENNVFQSCTGLTSVTIPNSVTSIGNYAFQSCSKLTGELKIPDSITTIGDYAFSGCSSLTSITIPNSVISIGNNAFYGCYRLTGELKIPDSVTSIGNAAFSYCSSLTSITIPDSVTSIGNNAFFNCYNLTSLTLGNSVTSIGTNTFYNCTKLTGELKIPDSVTTIGSLAFYNCTGLTSITIPDSVKSIGSQAFYKVPKIIYNGTATGSPWGATSVVTS